MPQKIVYVLLADLFFSIRKKIIIEKVPESFSYDKVNLATGSMQNMSAIRNAHKKNSFYRN